MGHLLNCKLFQQLFLNQGLPANGKLSETIIKNQIMFDKGCCFAFKHITEDGLEKLLVTIKRDKLCVVDQMEGRLFRIQTCD